MTTAPTLEDVARVAGVSRATASRVIRGDASASAKARSLVEAAVKQLGYVPNRAARSLATRRTDAIGVLISEPDTRVFSDPFFEAAIAGVSEALHDTALQLVLLLAGSSGTDERLLRFVRGGHADGFLLVSHHDDARLSAALLATGLSTAFVGRPLTGMSGPFADVDNAAGGRLVADHLVARGCRRPATICGPLDMPAAIDRLAGWRAGLDAAGLDATLVAHGDFTLGSGSAAAEQLLVEHPDVDAIFAANDLMAVGALRALQAAGRNVPEDVALVGFDDIGLATQLNPTLTSVSNPVRELASEATRMLMARLDGSDDDQSIVHVPLLQVRESSAPRA